LAALVPIRRDRNEATAADTVRGAVDMFTTVERIAGATTLPKSEVEGCNERLSG
jgi:hypothetical protein